MNTMEIGINEDTDIQPQAGDYVMSEDNNVTPIELEPTLEIEPKNSGDDDLTKQTLKYMLEHGKTLEELKTEKPGRYKAMVGNTDSKYADDKFIHILSDKNREFYKDDPKKAEEALKQQLTALGYDMEELDSRANAFNRFQGGLSKALVAPYNGLTGAEEGDISYDMEKQLNEETEANSELHKSLNFQAFARPAGGEGMFSDTGDAKTGDAIKDIDIATTAGEQAPIVAASMVGGTAAGAIGKGLGLGQKGLNVATAVGDTVGDMAITGATAASEQSDYTKEDVLLASLGGMLGYAMTPKTKAKLSNVFKQSDTFESLPSKYRSAVEDLAVKSGKTNEEIIKSIKGYDKSVIGDITHDDAIRGAAQTTSLEQVGQLIKGAKRSPEAKTGLLSEITKRSDIVDKAVAGDDVLAPLFKKHTIEQDDRKGTNWKALYEDLKAKTDLDDTDPLMKRVEENAKQFKDYDQRIHKKLIRPDDGTGEIKVTQDQIKPSEAVRATLPGVYGASYKASVVKKLWNRTKDFFSNEDRELQSIIQKSLEKGNITPKELKADLVKQGIDERKAVRIEKVLEKESIKLDQAQEKSDKKVINEYNKKIGNLEKNLKEKQKAMQAGLEAEKKAKGTASKQREAKYGDMADAEVARVKEETIAKHEADSAKWEDEHTGLLKGKLKQYNLAKRNYKKAIGTDKEISTKVKLDKIRSEAIEARDAKLEQQAVEKSQNEEASAMEAGLGKSDSDSILNYKPLSENKKNELAKGDRNPAQIRKEKSLENLPIGGDADKQIARRESAIKSDKRAREARLKEIEAGDEGARMEQVLAKETNTPEDKDTLKMILSHPDATDAMRKEAKTRLEDIARGERTSLVEKVKSKQLSKFDAAYRADDAKKDWAKEAIKHGRSLDDVEKKAFDKGLKEYYSKRGSMSKGMDSYLNPQKPKSAMVADLDTTLDPIIAKGRNIKARAARQDFMDTYGKDVLEKADEWIAEIKARTGKTRGLNEFVRSTKPAKLIGR